MIIEERCEGLGLRLTSQRRAVLRVLGDANDHPSLDTIHARARGIDPSVSVATVYRTLQFLCANGLALKHDFGPLSTRYELKRWDHHHLIDVDTGRIIEFASDTLDRLLRDIAGRLGFEHLESRVDLFGRVRSHAGRGGGAARCAPSPAVSANGGSAAAGSAAGRDRPGAAVEGAPASSAEGCRTPPE